MSKEKIEKVRNLAEQFQMMTPSNQEFIIGYMIGVQQEKRNRNKENTNKKDIIKN